MGMLPEVIQTLVDSAQDDTLVLIYVKKIICDRDLEFETMIKAKMQAHEKSFLYYTLCYESETIPFPEPHTNRCYFFLPKSKHYALAVDASLLARDFDRVVQTVGKRPEEVAHLYAEQRQAQTPEMTDAQVQEQTAMMAQEKLEAYPSAFQMARNLLKTTWDSAKGVAQGRRLLVTADEAHRRLTTCESCPSYQEKRCVHCGCMMEHKVHLQAATCPQTRWS